MTTRAFPHPPPAALLPAIRRWVQGSDDDPDAERALAGFERFPTWMWRNADVLDFVGWLRAHNERADRPTGFYGLDLYSLYRSIEAVIDHLARIDPLAAERARRRYACLWQFEDSHTYGYSVASGVSAACRHDVVQQLLDLRQAGEGYLRRDGIAAEDEQFYAEENARVVVAAEEYYRLMFGGPVSSWNLRDSMRPGCRRSGCHCATAASPPPDWGSRASSGRSASSTGPRPSWPAITSRHGSQSSSTS